MPKISKDSSAPAVTGTDTVPIGAKAVAYLGIAETEKRLKKEKESLRGDLEKHLKQEGEENDRGHILAVVSHAGVNVELKHELRNGSAMKGDAINIAKILFKGRPEILNRVIEKAEILRPDVIEVLHNEGTITDEDLQSLFEVVPSYAFKVRKI